MVDLQREVQSYLIPNPPRSKSVRAGTGRLPAPALSSGPHRHPDRYLRRQRNLQQRKKL